jgi:hypothetical protein
LTEIQSGDRPKDPGVPEALPTALGELRARVDPATMDRLWLFPPLRRGRRERGLVAVSVFLDGEARRRLLTAAYSGERSGLDLKVASTVTEEGDAPPEFLPRVMEGVVRRAGEGLGEPREFEIAGEVARFESLLDDLENEAREEVGS